MNKRSNTNRPNSKLPKIKKTKFGVQRTKTKIPNPKTQSLYDRMKKRSNTNRPRFERSNSKFPKIETAKFGSKGRKLKCRIPEGRLFMTE